MYPGAKACLTVLKQRGHLLAVATGKSGPGLEKAIGDTQTAHFFNATRTADVTASKPDPLMIHEILRELDIEAKDAVMIGDTTHDMHLAQNAGVDAIGIAWGVHDRETLSRFSPVAVIDSLDALL